MCFYDCIRYTCECWKWGKLRSQCNKEYRIDEVCGMKLCFQTSDENKMCRSCEKIAVKHRRGQELVQKIALWKKEGRLDQLLATADKYYSEISRLTGEVDILRSHRDHRRLAEYMVSGDCGIQISTNDTLLPLASNANGPLRQNVQYALRSTQIYQETERHDLGHAGRQFGYTGSSDKKLDINSHAPQISAYPTRVTSSICQNPQNHTGGSEDRPVVRDTAIIPSRSTETQKQETDSNSQSALRNSQLLPSSWMTLPLSPACFATDDPIQSEVSMGNCALELQLDKPVISSEQALDQEDIEARVEFDSLDELQFDPCDDSHASDITAMMTTDYSLSWNNDLGSDADSNGELFDGWTSLRPRIAQRLLYEYQNQKQLLSCHRTTANGQTADSQSKSDSSHGGGQEHSTAGREKGKQRKRGHGSSKDSEDAQEEGDEISDNRKKKARVQCNGIDTRLFACPFYKRHPRKHLHCIRYKLNDINRVKQHLLRKHEEPIHCDSCQTSFETEDDRAIHCRIRPPCEVLPQQDWGAVTKIQKKELSKRVSTQKSREENWYIVFEILFPESPKPRSPYLNLEFADFLLEFGEFAVSEVPAIASQILTEQSSDVSASFPSDLSTFTEATVRDAIDILLARFESRMPQAPQLATEPPNLILNNQPSMSSNTEIGEFDEHGLDPIFLSLSMGESFDQLPCTNWLENGLGTSGLDPTSVNDT